LSLNNWFEKGMTGEAYIESMKVNKDEMLSIYEGFDLNENEKSQLEKLGAGKIRAIVLTEDWCGDAMINNAVLMKIAENSGISLSFVLRDQNLELMDQYLTNGTSRAIPIFVFIDEEGNEIGVWGPRAPKIQAMVEERRATLPDKEAPDFADKQKEMYAKLMGTFRTDSGIWHEVAASIIGALQK
jgi:hypothetical protein